MKLKIVELLGAFKTAYVSHLAVSVTATALAGVLAIGGTGYGIYSATTKEAPAEVVAEAEVAPSEEAPVVTAKTEEKASEKVATEKTAEKTTEKTTEKKAVEKVSEKKEEKVETKETSEKVTSKTTEKASEKTTEKASSSAAESKKENTSSKTESKASAPAKTETKTATPAKTETAKAETPKAHTHTWVHHAEVTMPQYEMQYVVDVPAWDEPVTSTVTEAVTNDTEMVVNGWVYPPGTYTVGTREVTNTYMDHHDEQGHMEKVQVGTTVLEAAYDECAECGARR